MLGAQEAAGDIYIQDLAEGGNVEVIQRYKLAFEDTSSLDQGIQPAVTPRDGGE